MERLGALLKAIWPDAENVEKPLVFFGFGALAALGTVLERLGGVLKTSWRRFGAADAVAAATAASDAASKLLRSALASILSCFEALLERLEQFMFSMFSKLS